MKSVCRPVAVKPPRWPFSGTTFLCTLGALKHEVERRDAVVVVGARFDRHFFERRHMLVAGRPQDADIGRPIVHRPNEILGVARALEAVRDP